MGGIDFGKAMASPESLFQAAQARRARMRIAVGMEMKRIGSGRSKNKRADTSAEVGEDIAKRARKQEAEEEEG